MTSPSPTPAELTPSVQSPTTPGQYDLLQNADATQYRLTTILPTNLSPSVQSPTTPRTIWYTDRMHWYVVLDWPSLIEPTCTQPYYTENSITYWEMHTYPGQMDPPHWAQVYSALLHQNSITYWQMQTYPGQTDIPHPLANLTKVYRDLLHQYTMTLQNADIPSVMYPLIKPSCTEPCYTRTVWPIGLCRGTYCQLTPPTNQAHIYRILLHQDSMTYYRMHCYTSANSYPC